MKNDESEETLDPTVGEYLSANDFHKTSNQEHTEALQDSIKEQYIAKYTALWISIIFPDNNTQNQIINYFVLFNALFDLFKPHLFIFFIKRFQFGTLLRR